MTDKSVRLGKRWSGTRLIARAHLFRNKKPIIETYIKGDFRCSSLLRNYLSSIACACYQYATEPYQIAVGTYLAILPRSLYHARLGSVRAQYIT